MQLFKSTLYWIPIVYLLLINLTGFTAMWWDKQRATKHEWRIAEATLHIIGIVGGTIGILAGMYGFRHKTQKRSFQVFTLVGLVVSFLIYWIIIQMYI